jgi:hypothetical protein
LVNLVIILTQNTCLSLLAIVIYYVKVHFIRFLWSSASELRILKICIYSLVLKMLELVISKLRFFILIFINLLIKLISLI